MTAIAAGAPARPAFARMVVPLLALAVFINYNDRGNLATAAPLIKDELGLTSTQIGMLTSAFFWTYVPAHVLAGWLSERINAYRTLALGLAVWALATFLTGFAAGFGAILALRLALGVGESAIFPCSSKLIAQNVTPGRFGAVNSLLSQGLSLGPALGVFFGGLLMAAMGWRNVFLLFGAVSLLWLIPWLLATRRHSAEADSPQLAPSAPLGQVLRRRELWGATLGHLAGNYGFYFVISWLPLYLVKARGYSVPQMAMIGGLVYVSYAIAALASGWVTDHLINAGATPNRVRKAVAFIAHAGAAASLLTCAFGGPALSLASLFAAGVTLGLLSPHVYAIPQTLAGPRAAGKWVSVQNCVANLSGIVGPIVTGQIIDRTGGYDLAFAVAAGVTVTGLLGWCVIIPKIQPIDWDAA